MKFNTNTLHNAFICRLMLLRVSALTVGLLQEAFFNARSLCFVCECECVHVCECFVTQVLQGGVVSTSPYPQAGDHPSSAVHDCLFNLFAATFLIGGRSSIRNLRTRHAVATGTRYRVCFNLLVTNSTYD